VRTMDGRGGAISAVRGAGWSRATVSDAGTGWERDEARGMQCVTGARCV
jgi:hypothetical protein